MIKEYSMASTEETTRFGEDLGQCLRGQSGLVFLVGDLGAGKTVLTKGLVRGMGLKDMVTSPTYTLVNPYEDGDWTVYHMDLYRLEDLDELVEMGFDDFLAEEALIVVEWPQIIEESGLRPDLRIEVERTERDGERRIRLEYPEAGDMGKRMERLG